MSATRTTKYTTEISDILGRLGHATNADIASELRKEFPEVSDTTVHRVTARLCKRGMIALAPPTPDGTMRYDANSHPHDHFMCQDCARIRDIDVIDKLRSVLCDQIKDCQIDGRLVITGHCKAC